MNNMISQKKKIDSATIISAVIVACVYVAVFVAEQLLPSTSMLFTVLKKGATYALVAVSMNLCNGFTGIFSLGQAGFMLIGAFTYGILTIPPVERMNVYPYYNGGLAQFALPWFPAMLLAGMMALALACPVQAQETLPQPQLGARVKDIIEVDNNAMQRKLDMMK